MQMEQNKLEQTKIESEKDRQKDIEIALINAEAKQNPELDGFNMQKLMQDFELKQQELAIREKEVMDKSQIAQDKNNIAREGQNAKQSDS